MEDFSTILWILVIAAASLLSQGRKTRSGKTSRKPGPATDDTAPHPTPTTRPEWPGIPGFPKIPGFPEGGMHDGETRKAAAESAPEAPHAVSSPARKAAKSLSPSRKRPKEHPARISPKPEKQQRGSGGTRVPKAASRGTATGFRPLTARPGDGLGLPATGAHPASATIMAGFDRFGRQPVRREPDGRGAGGRNRRGFRSAQGRDLRRDTQTEIRRITVRTTPTRARGNAQTARYPSPTNPNRAWKYANIPDKTGTGKG